MQWLLMKLNAKITKAWHLQHEIEVANATLTSLKTEIVEVLNAHNTKKFVVESNDCAQHTPKYIASVTNRTSIKYDVVKLKQALDDDLFRGITNCEIKIDSPRLFMNTMKSLGLKPKDIRKFAVVNRELNKDKLNQMYDVGEISLKELKLCYTVNTASSVKITLQEESDNN